MNQRIKEFLFLTFVRRAASTCERTDAAFDSSCPDLPTPSKAYVSSDHFCRRPRRAPGRSPRTSPGFASGMMTRSCKAQRTTGMIFLCDIPRAAVTATGTGTGVRPVTCISRRRGPRQALGMYRTAFVTSKRDVRSSESDHRKIMERGSKSGHTSAAPARVYGV